MRYEAWMPSTIAGITEEMIAALDDKDVPIRINDAGLLEFYRDGHGMTYSPLTRKTTIAPSVSKAKQAVREAVDKWKAPQKQDSGSGDLSSMIRQYHANIEHWILHRFVLASSDFTLSKEGSHSESLYVVYGDYAYRHNADMYEPRQFDIGLAKAEAYLRIPFDESRKALEMRLHPEETEIEKQIYDFLGKKSKVRAKSLFDHFFQLVRNNDISRGCVLPVYNKANQDIEYALTSLRSPNVFGLYTIEPSDLADEPTPAWDEALNRIEPLWMREVFLATVWSALEPRASTRTIIWMTGPGGCGKSALLAVISSWFPEISKEFPHGTDNDKHTACQLEGKSIVTLSDCKNPRIHENQAIRNYSGNDMAVADRKGEAAYDIKIGFGNVFVNSNLMPEVDVHDEATATRVFPCKMRQVDRTVKKSSKYQDRLRLEKKGFLFKCKKAFDTIYLSKDRKDVAFSPERPQSYIEWTKDNCGKEMVMIHNFIVNNYKKCDNVEEGVLKSALYKSVLLHIGTTRANVEKEVGDMTNASPGMYRSGNRLSAVINAISHLCGGEFRSHLLKYPVTVVTESSRNAKHKDDDILKDEEISSKESIFDDFDEFALDEEDDFVL